MDKQGCNRKDNPRNCEQHPALYSNIVFCLDYKGMKKSDYKKCGEAHKKSGKVHIMHVQNTNML